MTESPAQTAQTPPTKLQNVPGWFPSVDQTLFTWFLERQERLDIRGDLLELGCYLGKSAILIGRHRRDDEAFTVCDLFDGPAPDQANAGEMLKSYSTLTRLGFETNYRVFHPDLPTIVQGPTSVILEHVSPDSCRFVHVD